MEILSTVGLTLIILAFTGTLVSAFTKRPMLNQVSTLTNALGCLLVAAQYGYEGSYGFMTFFLILAPLNVWTFFWSRSTERKRAAA